MEKEINQRLSQAIRAVIDQQIDERKPPETLETFERLRDEGFSEEESYVLIGHIISLEIAAIMKNEETYQEDRFVEALEKLPEPFAKPKLNN